MLLADVLTGEDKPEAPKPAPTAKRHEWDAYARAIKAEFEAAGFCEGVIGGRLGIHELITASGTPEACQTSLSVLPRGTSKLSRISGFSGLSSVTVLLLVVVINQLGDGLIGRARGGGGELGSLLFTGGALVATNSGCIR